MQSTYRASPGRGLREDIRTIDRSTAEVGADISCPHFGFLLIPFLRAADFITTGLFIIVPYLLWFWYRLIIDIFELILPPLIEKKEKERSKATEEFYMKNESWIKNASWLKKKKESKEDEKPYKKKNSLSKIISTILYATVFYFITGIILHNFNVW